VTLESRTDGEDNRRAGVRVAAGGIHQVVARLVDELVYNETQNEVMFIKDLTEDN